MRNTTTLKKSPVAKAIETPGTLDPFERFAAATDELYSSLGVRPASWARQIVSIVLAVGAYAAAWVGGIQLIDSLVALTFAATGAGLLTTFIVIAGTVLAFFASLYAGLQVYGFCRTFDFSRVERRVAGWFNRKEHAHA